MDSPFVYPILLIVMSLLMVIASSYEVGAGIDQKHITKDGTNLSVLGGCLGIILFFVGLVWLIVLAIARATGYV